MKRSLATKNLITSLLATVLLLHFMIKSPNPKVIFIPFLICSLSMAGKSIARIMNGVGIVTNNFHVFRAVQIAKVQGLEDVCGIAADSNLLYLPNNVLRECCGILKDWLMKNI